MSGTMMKDLEGTVLMRVSGKVKKNERSSFRGVCLAKKKD
jgi:hypothetical protein